MNKDSHTQPDTKKNGDKTSLVSNGMSKTETQQNNESQKCCLADSILDRIEQDEIAPTPRWRFLCHEYSIWGLWIASVVIGAAAVSVMIFVSLHAGYAFYEATHDSAWEFFLEVLPFVWVLVLVAMVALAYYNIRHTRKGYRYPLWQLIISSLLLSLVGGGALHAAGLGYLIDKKLSENMPMVRTLTGVEHKMWQNPGKGRMVGTFSGFVEENQTEASFTSVDGTEWVIDVSELMPKDIDLLVSGEKVRLLGMAASDNESYFYGCGVIPWMLERPLPVAKLREERDMFMERLEHHIVVFEESEEHEVSEGIEESEEREISMVQSLFTTDVATSSASTTESHCPEMPLLKKMKPKMPL